MRAAGSLVACVEPRTRADLDPRMAEAVAGAVDSEPRPWKARLLALVGPSHRCGRSTAASASIVASDHGTGAAGIVFCGGRWDPCHATQKLPRSGEKFGMCSPPLCRFFVWRSAWRWFRPPLRRLPQIPCTSQRRHANPYATRHIVVCTCLVRLWLDAVASCGGVYSRISCRDG